MKVTTWLLEQSKSLLLKTCATPGFALGFSQLSAACVPSSRWMTHLFLLAIFVGGNVEGSNAAAAGAGAGQGQGRMLDSGQGTKEDPTATAGGAEEGRRQDWGQGRGRRRGRGQDRTVDAAGAATG